MVAAGADGGYVIRGGLVVDGTGAPAHRADVAIEHGRITEIAVSIPAAGRVEVDATAHVVAPGFVDPHTHFDAQVFWDPDLTPSSWHGVTTVVTGNCGFTIAPTRKAHRETIARTLENTEGMTAETLAAGIDWSFETFPEYLAALGRVGPRLNVAPLLGHTALRLFVMGDAALERAATPEEIARMRAVVTDALGAGAVGFSTSRSPTHVGAAGAPVPSRVAGLDELFALVEPLRDTGGVLQLTAGPDLPFDEIIALARATGGPVTWAALLTGVESAGFDIDGALRAASTPGVELWPQMACRPIVMQLVLTDPFPFETLPAFAQILGSPRTERIRHYRDAGWLARSTAELHGRWEGDAYDRMWRGATVQETTCHQDLRGVSIGTLAAERNLDPWHLAVELAVAEGLGTRFEFVMANDDEDVLARLLRDPRSLVALSDAGAHASQLCDAGYATYLLGHWMRDRGVLGLEEAVWRLTGQPASVFRLHDRGRLAEGVPADVVVFDPETVASCEPERVYDQPGGTDRLIARARGIRDVWVNGVAVHRDGAVVEGARAGALLRTGPRP